MTSAARYGSSEVSRRGGRVRQKRKQQSVGTTQGTHTQTIFPGANADRPSPFRRCSVHNTHHRTYCAVLPACWWYRSKVKTATGEWRHGSASLEPESSTETARGRPAVENQSSLNDRRRPPLNKTKLCVCVSMFAPY